LTIKRNADGKPITAATSGRRSHLLRTDEAARLLGVSARTVRLWTQLGHLPAMRTLGGHRRFDEQALLSSRRLNARLAPQRILLVENEFATARGMERALTELTKPGSPRIECTVAESGWLALLQIARHPPDVVVINIRLAYHNGFDFIDAVFSDTELAKRMRIVVLAEPAGRGVKSGPIPRGVTILRKPVSPAKLIGAVIRS
jgi:excisionase family DNA binding protein